MEKRSDRQPNRLVYRLPRTVATSSNSGSKSLTSIFSCASIYPELVMSVSGITFLRKKREYSLPVSAASGWN